ncbi:MULTISPECIES: TRAP transporter large permease [Shouchella]|uniref:TRAP-type transport system permease DctM subunit n=3 Tax=Bacillaceae TaxID=186817 RepID=A0A060LXA4_9BACI|nr:MULTISPECIES: TRAP transporter large permease [Bacillaceae]RQW22520.1 TRAP transporter large permease [Bacillus sp. C1-1]AIC92913.1 TRAP-type transport system permease DctM subunit [Shouchella lehensis G1]KQL56194.1 C4-dicarboxylate ABC transporter permease [Alkalicoccobacillus plakortidis]MBG9783282.1 C4-dicarboxylate ABC transporter permease [Shouchella lehensis]TES49343.1 TRAP transporter large permease [Shouchella lehensis]
MAILVVVLFLLFIAFGIPIAFSLGLASLIYLLVAGVPLTVIPQTMFAGMNSFVMLAIPAFILAGNLMNAGGITNRIIDFANAIVGHIRGGLALTNVASSLGFAGISGTALSDTASIGSVMIPAMKKQGYGAGFSAAVTSISSTVGPMLPPSLPMIIIGTLASVSIGDLFLAGAIPGILLAIGFLIVTYIISVKRQYPKGEKQPLSFVGKSFLGAFWALLMVVIIMWGILGGYFTPTEAAVVCVLYAFVIGKFVYKELQMKELPQLLGNTLSSTASILLLVGFANTFGWILVSEGVPLLIADGILSITENPILVILLIILLLLILGMFMETIAALVILFPVLLPVATSVGMDPVHFGVVMVLALMIGLSTPPVGVCLFVASSFAKVPITKTVKELLPYFAVAVVVLIIVAYVPSLSLFLPSLFE